MEEKGQLLKQPTAEADDHPGADNGAEPATEVAQSTDRFVDRYPWAYHAESTKYANAEEPVNHQVGGNVGPTIYWMTASAVITMLTQVGVFGLTLRFSSCQHGIATYPALIWTALLPAALLKMYAEWYSLKFVTLPYSLRLPFKILTKNVGFLPWLGFHGILSQFQTADIGSDSMFAGTTLVALSCPRSDLRGLWEREWSRSLLGLVGAPAPHLQKIIVGFWMFSLLQMIVPVVRTIRKGAIDEGHAPAALPCFGDLEGDVLQREMFFCRAQASGMTTLDVMSISAGAEAIKCTNLRSSQSMPASAVILGTSVSLQSALIDRMIFSYVGENCVQLNIQSTIYVLQLAVAKTHGTPSSTMQLQMFISIIIGMAMSLLKLSEAKEVLSAVSIVYEARLAILSEDAARVVRCCRRQWFCIVASFVVLVGTLFYAAAKIIMAHVCATALWNITGCVT